jgi:uncharacterized protein (TIGR02145 family)
MKKILTIILLYAAVSVWVTGCKEDSAQEPELLAGPAVVNATSTAGDYTIAITANVDWTATVDAEWLAVNPVSGTGNGTVTVSVSENARAEIRNATVTFTSSAVKNAAIVMQDARPLYAASAKTWVIGNQTWSDVIQMPDSNDDEFESDDRLSPQSRSYTDGDGTSYYYNWAYVNQRSADLCPAPWHVPTNTDFVALDMALGGNGANRVNENPTWVREQYIAAWGATYGGSVDRENQVVNRGASAHYWSSMPNGSLTAYSMIASVNGIVYPQLSHYKVNGFMVRCVK